MQTASSYLIRLGILSALVVGLSWAGGSVARAELPDPADLVSEMADAASREAYDGVFIYQRGGATDTMRVIHDVRDGVAHERLISLTGSEREVLRTGDKVRCVFPEARTVLIEQGPSEFVGKRLSLPLEEVQRSYAFKLVGQGRVAGRQTWVVQVSPRKEDRFGYHLWIDKDTSLLLKSTVIDQDFKPLEQLMFTRIVISREIPEELFEPKFDTTGFTVYSPDSGAERGASGPYADLAVDVDWIPAGFKLSQKWVQPLAATGVPVHHLVYTDGLATVSLFVEADDAAEDSDDQQRAAEQSGAMSTLSRRVGSHLVTAVGEVPETTAAAILDSVRLETASQ